MKILKNIFSQLHRYIIWALILSLFWSFVYTRVGDRPPEKKLVFYIGAYASRDRELSLYLEELGMPEGIEMIRVRNASYDLFGSSRDGDLYLVRESDLQEMIKDVPDRLASIQAPEGLTPFLREGVCYGFRVFDPGVQRGPAMSYIQYTPLPEPEPEPYYIVFDANTLHLSSAPNGRDDAAWELAMEFLKIDDEKE